MSNRTIEHEFLQGALFEVLNAFAGERTRAFITTGQPLRHHFLLYSNEGTVSLKANGHALELKEDELYVFMPGTRLEIGEGQNSLKSLYVVNFNIYRTNDESETRLIYERDLTFPSQGPYRLSGSLFMRLYGALEESVEDKERRRFAGQQLLYDLLDALLSETPIEGEDDADARLKRAIGYMLRNYREDIRIDRLAEVARLHPSYFSQIFRQTLLRTPVSFLTNLRMNKAKEMLLLSDKPIRDIAREVGYEDEFYFSRRFKKTNGIAPTVYARKSDMRVVSLSFPCTDHLFTLGLQPAAAQLHPFHQEDMSRTSVLKLPKHGTDPWTIDRRFYLQANPDLIVCKDNVLSRARENLNDVAPIVALSWSTTDVFEHLRLIGKLVNKEKEAEQWMERHERRARQVGKFVRGSFGQGTVAICVVRGEKLRIYGARNIGHVFYRMLNLSPPERVAERMKPYPAGTVHNWIAISEEEFGLYESDFMFFVVEDSSDRLKVNRLLRTNPAWSGHSAVRSGRYAFLDWGPWMIYAPSMLDWQLEEAARLLGGARASIGSI